ncbi:hypothetical protein RQP46_009703 [Phenoliferia psychrophenolica]
MSGPPPRGGGGGGGRYGGGDHFEPNNGPQRRDTYAPMGEYDNRRAPPPHQQGGDFQNGGGYGGRRSRSPEWDDRRGGGKRRRSLSPRRGDDRPREYFPPQRDGRPAYRDERDDFRDGSAYPPPPRPSYNDDSRGPVRPRTTMERPEDLPYLVTQRYFTDYLRSSSPSFPVENLDAVEIAFRKYTRAFARRSFHPFFVDMKRRVWFRERYEPSKEAEEARKVLRKRGREGRMDRFVDELESGKLDELVFDVVPNKTEPQNGVAPTNGTPAVATAAAAAVGEDTEMKPAVESEAEEVKPKAEDDDEPMRERDAPRADGDPAATDQARPSATQLVIKAISPDLSRKDLETHCSQCAGFEYLALSEPNPLKNFMRVGWVTFKDAASMLEASKVLCESTVGTFTLHMQPSEPNLFAKSKLTPSEMGTPDRIAKDLDQVRLVAQQLERDGGGDARGSELIEQRFESAREAAEGSPELLAALNKKTLDLYLHYVRLAFNSCYYCVASHDFPEELERRCPRHLRKTPDMDATRNISRKTQDNEWIKKLDERMPLLANREGVDPVDFGGDSYDDELHNICLPKVKHEEEGKFRCRECHKLFSALKFIEKHLSTKHPEVLGDRLDELQFFNNYILDPIHPLAPHELEALPAAARPALGESGRSLNDRIGERLEESNYGGRNGGRRGGRDDDRSSIPRGPPPPPPPGAVLDPRARKGASSYADLDGTPAGVADIVLQY